MRIDERIRGDLIYVLQDANGNGSGYDECFIVFEKYLIEFILWDTNINIAEKDDAKKAVINFFKCTIVKSA